MQLRSLVVVAVTGCSAAGTDAPRVIDEGPSTTALPDDGPPEGARVLRAKDASPGPSSVSLLTWHGGSVLQTTEVGAVFWGASWGSYSGDKISGMATFFSGLGGSAYAGTCDEYGDANGNVTSTITLPNGDIHIDTSAASKRAARSVSVDVSEVCKWFPNAVSNGFYAVYTDTPRGGSSFCAWHSYGRCNGVEIQVAFFFDLDGDRGCTGNLDSSTGYSQGLQALANVTAHEISEARTDPHHDAWYDASGDENGDKCAWTFGPNPVTLSNNTTWWLQGEWSNAAYTAGTGYYLGCITE